MADNIEDDLKRAEDALNSAERNFSEEDNLTAANRTFVACENSVYALLKHKFGSASLSRIKILTRLKDIDAELKETYDKSYDLRVQADYGKEAKLIPLTKENLKDVLENVKKHLDNIKGIVSKNGK